jgi:glucose/arabinose dehydrogenase
VRLLGLVVALSLVATSTALVGAFAGAVSSSATKPIVVRVAAKDFSFGLSRRSVPSGSTVRFVVRNRGSSVHDFVIKARRTRKLNPGQSQVLTVRFPRKGTFRFLCSISGHARLGMRGSFGVAKRPPPAPPPPPVDTSDVAKLTKVGSFDRPVLVTAPPDDTGRIFVVEQTGSLRVVRDGVPGPVPFLDIREKVKGGSEPGLLALAFPPDYGASGTFYVVYNARSGNGDLRLSEFHRHQTDPDRADPYSERVLLTITKPWENHNGGMLQFGPDGYLYWSVGDGDSGLFNPPGFYAQRRDDLLGNILRIDPRGKPYAVPADNPFVGVDGVRPEIWAYGLRNPWRFWIDAETGAMYIGDAGNARREEVDLVPRGRSGLNFGWPCFEGTLAFDEKAVCDSPVPPLLEYPREGDACAVIGGVVVRDRRLADLVDRYLYSDFCSGKITAIVVDNGQVTSSGDLGLVVPQLTSFGVDALDRVYVLSLTGEVYRLDPKP